MITKFEKENGNYNIPIELPGNYGKKTPEEIADTKAIIESVKQEYPDAVISTVKWGWRIFRAIVIEGDRDLYETIMHEEDVVQKRKSRDERCIISDGSGHAVRCPSQLANPEYDHGKPQGKGNRKTIMNTCDGCPYNTFDRPDFSTQSLEDMLATDEDDENDFPDALKAGIQRESDRYLAASKEVLDLIARKYPDKLPEFPLRLAEVKGSEIAKILGKNTSSLYKIGKGITNDLLELLDSLWYLNIKRR